LSAVRRGGALGGRLLAALLVVSCAGLRGPGGTQPLHLSELTGEGDPIRRASLRLCVNGLDADEAGRPQTARSLYERAIQIDPTNPYAYLALARHEVERGDPERALEYVAQAETLLASEEALSPRVEPHLDGLRGAALEASGRDGSEPLAHARRASPQVWDDGRLSAGELR